MKALMLSALLMMSSMAAAYTTHRCETLDERNIITLTFDAADNYFVYAGLAINGADPIGGELQGDDRFRPTPIQPNLPALTLKFNQSVFVLSVDAKSASLKTDGNLEAMNCCSDLGNGTPCAGRL